MSCLIAFAGATSDSSTSCHDDPVLSNILITVFMIDEGMTAKVRIGSIRRLDKRFAELPVQAIHCYLGGAAPLKYDLNSGEAISELPFANEYVFVYCWS